MLPGELQGAIARGAAAVILTPRGQNPTGAAFDERRAGELQGRPGRAPRTAGGRGRPPGSGCRAARCTRCWAGARRWATTRSVAKAFGPDLRLAVLAGDETTIARVRGRQQRGPGWVSYVLQTLVLELWSDPAVGELIERAAATYTRAPPAADRSPGRPGHRGQGRLGFERLGPGGRGSGRPGCPAATRLGARTGRSLPARLDRPGGSHHDGRPRGRRRAIAWRATSPRCSRRPGRAERDEPAWNDQAPHGRAGQGLRLPGAAPRLRAGRLRREGAAGRGGASSIRATGRWRCDSPTARSSAGERRITSSRRWPAARPTSSIRRCWRPSGWASMSCSTSAARRTMRSSTTRSSWPSRHGARVMASSTRCSGGRRGRDARSCLEG